MTEPSTLADMLDPSGVSTPSIISDQAQLDVPERPSEQDQPMGDPVSIECISVPAPPTKREREAEWMRAALATLDLTDVTTSELRVLANRMFLLLDAERPPFDAGERYAAAVEEIEARAAQARTHGTAETRRQVFKNSAFGSRFELFLDGSLAAYLRYSLVDGRLTLRALVETPGFEGRGLTPILLRQAMLHAHKRRLGVIPGCPEARAFLEQNPQYRILARVPR